MKSNIEAGKHLVKAKRSFLQFLLLVFLAFFTSTFWNLLGIGSILSIVTLKLFTIEGLRVITTGILLLFAFFLFLDATQELGISGEKLQGKNLKKSQTFKYRFKKKKAPSLD